MKDGRLKIGETTDYGRRGRGVGTLTPALSRFGGRGRRRQGEKRNGKAKHGPSFAEATEGLGLAGGWVEDGRSKMGDAGRLWMVARCEPERLAGRRSADYGLRGATEAPSPRPSPASAGEGEGDGGKVEREGKARTLLR